MAEWLIADVPMFDIHVQLWMLHTLAPAFRSARSGRVE
jgi:hypothetical protein